MNTASPLPTSGVETLIHRRVSEARNGVNPTVVAKMRSGWAVLADRQVTHAYCLLLPDPVVPTLNALIGEARRHFLEDMTLLGDALLNITNAVRINYEILGNADPALHAHVVPRYDDEPVELKKKPIWFYDWEKAPVLSPTEQESLAEEIRSALSRLGLPIERIT